MNLRRLHRRLAVIMALAALLAFAGGAGVQPFSTILAAAALFTALFWNPSEELSSRLERLWVPLAGVLVLRALFHVFVINDDVVLPVVDLLLLLLAAESLRSHEAVNDFRLYALSFALILASAAYRPGIFFALAFLVYVVVGTLALFVGHLRREAERNGVERLEVGRKVLVAVGGLSSITLVVAIGVFLTFPRVSQGWAGRGETPTRSVAGFSDQVSIGEFGATIYGNPQIVLRVEFPDSQPADPDSFYWRGRSYDRFDGVRWIRSRRLPPSLAPETWYRERWSDTRITQNIYQTALQERVLFGLHPVIDIDSESRIQPLFDNSGDYTYWGSVPPVYDVVSMDGRPSAEELRAADGRFAPARGYYTQLPELPGRIRALGDSLAGAEETRYDKVVAIRDWLRSEFSYTLQLPESAREATLDHFLFERRAGHCEYFSTALAVLLRTQGIPTRNVNGFLGGEWSNVGRYLAVTQNQARSWIEVWFPDYGWVPFDATPAGGGGLTDEARTAWFWPGRFLFDAIQHRWGKWVLDYDMDMQFDLLEQASAALGDPASGATDRPDDESGSGWSLVWIVAGALMLVSGLARALAMRNRHPVATREYLRLRKQARKAGIEDADRLAPLALLARIRERARSASDAATEAVDIYLRVRFAGEPMTEPLRERLSASVSRARSHLRSKTGGRRE